MKTRETSALINLMLLIVIEVMGVGIIVPMLPELFILKSSPLLTANTSSSIRYLCYGLSIALLPLGMFFGTPFLGELSDKIGRKKVFLVCLTMTALSYVFCAVSIYLRSMSFFLFSRFFAGFFSGSYDIAQAAAADISTKKNKARNMGWIELSLGIGFIIGPLITSMFSRSGYVHVYGITTPFWIACALALLNALSILFMFHDTYKVKKKYSINFTKIFSSFLFVFIDKRLTQLSIILFFMVCAWIVFFTGISIYLVEIFHMDTSGIGLFYCILGISSVITILFIQSFILKLFSLKKIIMFTAYLNFGLLLIPGLFPISIIFAGIVVFIFALIELLMYSSFIAVYSNAVTEEEQGRTLGGSGSVGSVAFLLGSLVAAELSCLDSHFPLILSAVFYLIVGILSSRR